MGLPKWEAPASTRVRTSLLGYWSMLRGLAAHVTQACELLILHVPQDAVAALKATATGGLAIWMWSVAGTP